MKKSNFILACIIIIINLFLIFTIIISIKMTEKKIQGPKINEIELLNSDVIVLFNTRIDWKSSGVIMNYKIDYPINYLIFFKV